MSIKGWIKHSDAVKDEQNPLTQEVLDSVYTLDHPEIKSRMNMVDASALPSSFSLLNNETSVRDDQGDLGLCFAFAGCGLLEYYLKNASPSVIDELSEMFLGYYSRLICDGAKPSGDNGSTIIATMQAMQQYGVCLSTLWPYLDEKENVTPSATALAGAKTLEVGKYFAIPNDSNKITAIKQSLYAGAPVMYGSDVHNSIMNVGSNGIEPYSPENSTTDPVDGGHARFILGFDDTKVILNAPIKGAFLVMNSWSNSWGMNGLSWISYQTWLDQETDDMGITNIVTPTPTPTPNPSPVTPTPSPADCTKFQAAIKLAMQDAQFAKQAQSMVMMKYYVNNVIKDLKGVMG